MMKKSFDEIVVFARTGLNPRTNFKLGKGTNKYITIKNIHNNTILIDDNTDVVDDEAIKLIHKRSQIKKGDILFCSIGRLGDMYIIQDKPIGWDINESVFAFTLNTDLIRQKFFYYVFKHHKTIEFLSKNSSGSTFKSIKMNQLKRMTFDVPTLEEQDNIITVLDNVCKIIELLKQQIQQLDELVKARFIELFGDPEINPKNLNKVLLSEIAEYFNGLTYAPDNVSDNGIVVLRSSNIQNSQLDFNDTVRVNCVIKEKLYVKDNDILMCARNGSAKLVGKVALINNIAEPMTFGAFMMIIRSEYYPYLMTYFQMDAFRRQITTGATTTINQITGNMLNKISLPLPEMDDVKQFADFVKQIDKSKVVVQKALDEAQTLFDSLMQEYFG